MRASRGLVIDAASTMTPALLILAVVAAFCALPLSANADAPDPMITLWSDLTEVEPGDKVAFTIEVTNRGEHATVDAVVTDVIPEYLDIVWHATTQGQIVVDGQTVRADIGTVGPQFVVRIYIYTQVREDVPQPHEMENVAVLTSPNAGERRSEPLLLRVPPAEMPLTGGAGSIWLVCSGGFVALLALALWEGSRDHPPEPSSL